MHNVSVGVALQPKTTREVTQSVPLLMTQEFPARDRKKKEEPIGGGGLWEVQLFVAPSLLDHSRARALGGRVELEGRGLRGGKQGKIKKVKRRDMCKT